MQAIVETVFDIVYLCTVITLGLIMIRAGRGHRQYVLFGIMAVTLGAGDAFHLVPGACVVYDGIGKLYVRVGNWKIHHVHHDDDFLCFIVLCLASAVSGRGKQGLTRIVYCWRRCGRAVSVPAEWLDQRQRSAILGNLPQHPIRFTGIVDHRVVLSKHKGASRRGVSLHEPDDHSQFRLLYSGCAVGGYPSVNWNVDDSEDLRLCVDGVDWLFRHAQRASGKIRRSASENTNSRGLEKSGRGCFDRMRFGWAVKS